MPHGEMTPGRLYDILDEALIRAAWTWRHPFRNRRYVLWLNKPFTKIGAQTWWASASDELKGNGYTRQQVLEMKDALRPILAARKEDMEDLTERLNPNR